MSWLKHKLKACDQLQREHEEALQVMHDAGIDAKDLVSGIKALIYGNKKAIQYEEKPLNCTRCEEGELKPNGFKNGSGADWYQCTKCNHLITL